MRLVTGAEEFPDSAAFSPFSWSRLMSMSFPQIQSLDHKFDSEKNPNLLPPQWPPSSTTCMGKGAQTLPEPHQELEGYFNLLLSEKWTVHWSSVGFNRESPGPLLFGGAGSHLYSVHVVDLGRKSWKNLLGNNKALYLTNLHLSSPSCSEHAYPGMCTHNHRSCLESWSDVSQLLSFCWKYFSAKYFSAIFLCKYCCFLEDPVLLMCSASRFGHLW